MKYLLLPNINSANRAERLAAERIARNMPIQGTAADIMKIAMIRLHDTLRREKVQSRILLQVHDELVLEAPEAETPEAIDAEAPMLALDLAELDFATAETPPAPTEVVQVVLVWVAVAW